MPVAQLITKLDSTVFEGLKADGGDLCTVEVTTPTGLEDVCAEEASEKFGVAAHTAPGRSFFDIPLQHLPQVLKLRSVENVHVVIHMQPNFPFTNTREDCFSALYSLVQRPLWRKGLRAWQAVFGVLEDDPFTVDTPLTKAFQEPNPVLDLRKLKKGSPVSLNLPEDVKRLREQHAQIALCSAGLENEKLSLNEAKSLPDDRGAPSDASVGRVCDNSTDRASVSVHSTELHVSTSKPSEESKVAPRTSSSSSSPNCSASDSLDVHFVNSISDCAINDSSSPSISSALCSKEMKTNHRNSTASSRENLNTSANEMSNSLFDDNHSKTNENPLDFFQTEVNMLDDLAKRRVHQLDSTTGIDEPSARPNSETICDAPRPSTRDNSSGPSFRVCCNRAGTSHVFGSPEAARQLGAAINDRFAWPVMLKNYLLEVVLNITDDFVYVTLGLTKDPLYRRNLVSFGPTNLRATLCYALVHLARPRPGDLILDHMCGGASIPIEGAQCYPQCYHVGGELNSKAVERAATNFEHMELQKGASLPAGLLRWDARKIPFRDGCVDAVVSDLPFGKRSGSKADNRTLYLSALQETARVVRPGTGRAVLLTHDRNSMIKNLAHVREFWRNPSTRTINIGGLYAGVFLLCRTAALYTSKSSS